MPFIYEKGYISQLIRMIIYLDTETTGLNPGQICQLSYVIQEGGKACAKNFFFSVDYVEYSAFAVHGFSTEILDRLSGGKGFERFIDEIENDFNCASVICAHNTSFDFQFLRKEFERCGREFMPKADFCTMKKSISACKLIRPNSGGYKYPRLNELCAYLGIADGEIQHFCKKLFGGEAGYHDARFDTTAVFLAVNKGIEEIGEFEPLKEHLL